MDSGKIKQAVLMLLEGIGENPQRPGLVETPDRVARMCEELYSGVGADPKELIKVVGKQEHDEIILVRDVPFYSMCEHHLLPFTGLCHVAYIPNKKITGLSKLVRVVETCARRLQVQERLTTEIADAINERLSPKGVMVVMEAEHLCMTMRGVRKPGSRMTTSVVRGIFRTNAKTRAEAMVLISHKGTHKT